VTGYTASTSFSPGSITINGTVFQIAPGVVPTTPFTFVIGNNICLTMTFNSSGQIVAAQGTSNVTGLNLVCGVYQPTGVPGSISVGGFTFGLAGGFFFPFTLIPGQFYCFVQAPGGAIVQALSTIPTSIHVEADNWHRAGHMWAG